MSTLVLPIKFFGMFRKFGKQVEVEIPSGSSVLEIKSMIIQKLGAENKDLVDSSVLANTTDILPDAYIFNEVQNLSILPPVCGG
ncbi:MAG: hypothetical protein R3D88_08815 [Alphaproteobacteria bacterium]|jgi:molybdopterin converting factor small subunit